MFDWANWQNPETLMLNLMNAALGLALVAWLARLGWPRPTTPGTPTTSIARGRSR